MITLIRNDIQRLPLSFIDRKQRPIILRPGADEDRQTVIDMYRGFKPEDSYHRLPPPDPDQLVAWVNMMFDQGFNITGLSSNNRIICHGAIFKIDEHRSEFIIAVKPDFQDAGVGMRLTRIMKQASMELGFSQIWLSVESYNAKARHIYTKLGFKVISSKIGEEIEMVIDLDRCHVEELPK